MVNVFRVILFFFGPGFGAVCFFWVPLGFFMKTFSNDGRKFPAYFRAR